MNYTWNVARMSQDPWIKNFLFFFHSAGQLLYTRNYDSLLSIYHLDSPHIITYYYNNISLEEEISRLTLPLAATSETSDLYHPPPFDKYINRYTHSIDRIKEKKSSIRNILSRARTRIKI